MNLERRRAIWGEPGSGKSEAILRDLYEIARDRSHAVVCLDSPGTLARKGVGHLSRGGMEHLAWYELGRKTDRVLSWRLHRADGDLSKEEFAQAFWAMRGLKDGIQKPYTKKYLDAAIGVWGSMPIPVHLTWLLKCFEPDSVEHDHMMHYARDREAVRVFTDVERRRKRSPVQYEIETGAAERLLQPARAKPVWARNGDSFDWEWALENKMHVYFDLSGLATEVKRTLAILVSHAVIQTCVRRFDRTGVATPTVLVLEEAGALGLVTPTVIAAMQEHRRTGLAIWVVSQTIFDM
jgi:hypothetical protein